MTTSTLAGSVAAASGRCVRARTGTPAASSWSMTTRPTRPVAPVTSTGGTGVDVMRTPMSEFTIYLVDLSPAVLLSYVVRLVHRTINVCGETP